MKIKYILTAVSAAIIVSAVTILMGAEPKGLIILRGVQSNNNSSIQFKGQSTGANQKWPNNKNSVPSPFSSIHEFSSLDKSNATPGNWTIALTNGGTLDVSPNSILGVAYYPTTTAVSPAELQNEAKVNIALIQDLINRFTDHKTELMAVVTKWQTAVAKPVSDSKIAQAAQQQRPDESVAAAEQYTQYANDKFVKPADIQSLSPTYEDTIAFLQNKMKIGSNHAEMGFGQKTKKFIVRIYFYDKLVTIIAFDPANLSPVVKTFTITERESDQDIERGKITLESTNSLKKISLLLPERMFTDGASGIDCQESFSFKTKDVFDAEGVSKAWSHLIEMFGGKPDSF